MISLSSEVKQPKYEAAPPLSVVEFNNVWKYTSTPPHAFILGTAEGLPVLNNST